MRRLLRLRTLIGLLAIALLGASTALAGARVTRATVEDDREEDGKEVAAKRPLEEALLKRRGAVLPRPESIATRPLERLPHVFTLATAAPARAAPPRLLC